jgi:hypothetical protein
MAGETFTSMFVVGFKVVYGGLVWLMTLGKVSTTGDNIDTSTTIPKNNDGFISTDTIVSLLFIIHIAAVVAFIVSHCKKTKQKSQ